MIMIFGTFVQNRDTSRCFVLIEMFIFWAVRVVKGQKIVQNEK